MSVVKVVRYGGGSDDFAWKFPSEELGTWTQVIVDESQEAVLFRGGQAFDVFGVGQYILSTDNIPLLSNVLNLPPGGRSPFAAEVWYVNKLNLLEIKWGTGMPIRLQDPKYKVSILLRVFGQFDIAIRDARTFLTRFAGMMPMLDKDNIAACFRDICLANIKDAISTYLVRKGMSAREIGACLPELSAYFQEKVTPMLETYGVNLLNFYVTDVSVPGDDSLMKEQA